MPIRRARPHGHCFSDSERKADEVKKYKDYYRNPYLATYYFTVNVAKKPLNDVRVRRALSLSIDREKITEKIVRMGQIPTQNLVPYGQFLGYQAEKFSIYEPQKAKQLLADAGYPDGKGFPAFTLTYNTHKGHRQIAEAVQEMWKNTLGIKVQLKNMEWRIVLDEMKSKNFEMVRSSWIADYRDPLTFLGVFLSESGANHTNWKTRNMIDWF